MNKNKIRSIISFSVYALFILGCYFGIKWVGNQPKVNGIPGPLRSVLSLNERIFTALFFPTKKSKEFGLDDAQKRVRKNGLVGMQGVVNDSNYKLIVIKNNLDTLFITMDEIKKLPKTEVIFDFKCIEGWSQITHWSGVKFSDFAAYYKLATKSGNTINIEPNEDWYKYAGLETPDGKYFVGIDMPSMMQQQTILCYEMNGKPLPNLDGAPLRLIIPVKYGVKHLKRIGKIFFADEPPKDYWAKYGYDYFAGL